jgi:Caspase domain
MNFVLSTRHVLSFLALLMIVFAFASRDAGAAERRVAFVVGNGKYQTVPVLPNPSADAQAVATALKKSGFEVITAVDLDQSQFQAQFESFIRSLNGADLSLFYYSGHGIQIGGDNRIIPIDANLSAAADLEIETISLRSILKYMKDNSKTQLLYLDACRNNPFPSSSFLVGPDKEIGLTTLGLAVLLHFQLNLAALQLTGAVPTLHSRSRLFEDHSGWAWTFKPPWSKSLKRFGQPHSSVRSRGPAAR